MAVVQFRTNDEMYAALSEIARTLTEETGQRVTVSEVARFACERFIKFNQAKTALKRALRPVGPAPSTDVVQPITFDKPDVVQPVVQERGVGWTD